MKVRLAQPAVLIDIARVGELSGIRIDGRRGGHRGDHAGTRTSPARSCSRAEVPILAYAAAQVGDPQIRHRGTIGGSLAHADPSADLPMTLLALGGSVEITGPAGVRDGRRRRLLRRAVRVGARHPTSCCRRSGCRAAARCRGATRSSSGGPTTGPSSASPPTTAGSRWPAWAAPRCARSPSRRRCGAARPSTEAAALAAEGTSPGYDFHADVDYREHLARVLTKRALQGRNRLSRTRFLPIRQPARR